MKMHIKKNLINGAKRQVGENKIMYIKNKYKNLWPLTIFMLAFYIVDILRLYLEHVYGLHIDRLFTWVLPTKKGFHVS